MEQTSQFNFKEVYDAKLKTLTPIDIGVHKVEAGETIVAFDRIQSLSITSTVRRYKASGGFDNRPQIWWENVNGANVYISQGIASQEQISIMSNSKLWQPGGAAGLNIPIREIKQPEMDGTITLSHEWVTPIFAYHKGEKITVSAHETDLDKIIVDSRYALEDIVIDYYYNYNNDYQVLTLGRVLSESSYFDFSCRSRIKDDITGKERTAYVHIPKLKIFADLSVRLGTRGAPITDKFEGQAIPVGTKGNTIVMELFYLDNDIDADI